MSVSLSAGMRSAVYSMGDIQSQIDVSNKRLATGKKINSAIDNARSYFAAQTFNTEATKLNGLIEGMSQARQTIDKVTKAIDGGIRLLQSAESLATRAVQSTTDADRQGFQTQVADLLNQAARLFADGNFNGKQMLINDTQTGANYGKAVGTASNQLGFTVGTGTGQATAAERAVYDGGVLDVQTNTATSGFTSINLRPIDVRLGAATTINGAPGGLGLAISSAGNETGFVAAVGSLTPITAGVPVTSPGPPVVTNNANTWLTGQNATIERFRTATQAAVVTLQARSAQIATQASTIDIRIGFSKDTARINNEAADNLVVADINEEGANLSALQTKQQLAVQALSLASRADQAILRLF